MANTIRRFEILRSFGVLDDAVLLDTREVGEILGLTAFAIRNWRRLDPPKGPHFVTVGRLIRYPVRDLRLWLAARVPTSDFAK